jgi:type I restriction enzyme, S subunit
MNFPDIQTPRRRGSRREEGLTASAASNRWQWVKVGELTDTCSGTTPSRGRNDYYGGEIPWVKTGELVDGEIHNTEEHVTEKALKETSLRLLPKNTLLVAMYGQGQTRGRTALLKTEATINQACFAILPNERFDSEFLQFWFCHSYQRLRLQTEGRGGNQPNLNGNVLRQETVPLPPLVEQRRIAERLREQLAEVERARAAVQAQLDAAQALPDALLRESLKASTRQTWRIPDILTEVTAGIGERWDQFPVLGATRAGLAPAKESVGKNPGRYKPVTPGTVFYNPMRILLGSIALVDEGDASGITSPDYVVMRGIEGRLHSTWFYHWFRSPAGAEFIQSLTRGAVRERLLFNRLAKGEVTITTWDAQLRVVERLRALKPLVASLQTRQSEIERLPAALLRVAFQPPHEPGHF